MKSVKSITLITLVLICAFIFIYRVTGVSDRESSWDVLGYYLYLPATFVYEQPMLNDIAWLQKINAEKNLTGTLYQVSTNDDGEPIYFFLTGMALLLNVKTLGTFRQKIFLATFPFFIVSFFIISNWSSWWYVAPSSVRPMIILYSILALSLGYMMVCLKWILLDDHYDDTAKEGILSEEKNNCYRFKENQDFHLFFESPYEELTLKDHFWVKASTDNRYPDNFEGPLPCFIMTMERMERSYRYSAPEIRIDSSYNHWKRIEFDYLTPEIRNSRDHFKVYTWERGKSAFDIDNIR